MSVNKRLANALGVILGAQALAFAASAQTPDTTRQTDRTATQSTTGEATSTRDHTATDPSDRASSSRSQGADADEATGSHMDHSKDHANMKAVSPQSFATQAATISKAEVELAQLALNNTKNEEIRLYAERMVKDHTAAGEKLTQIASEQNIQLPQKLDAKHQAVKQKLSGLQGDAFDREYKKQMMMGHQEAVALFESASQSQQMPEELKEFAASTLPTLERHQKMAEGLDTDEGA